MSPRQNAPAGAPSANLPLCGICHTRPEWRPGEMVCARCRELYRVTPLKTNRSAKEVGHG